MDRLKGLLASYDPQGHFCELLGSQETTRLSRKVRSVIHRLDRMNLKTLQLRARAAERELYNLGITFTVYSDAQAIDRILPFDVLPRLLSAADFDIIERGVQQRVATINAFLHDVYHKKLILKDKVVPQELVLGNVNYCKQMVGVEVPGGTYVHICGIDIVRDRDGRFKVLEDNARTPRASPTWSRTGT